MTRKDTQPELVSRLLEAEYQIKGNLSRLAGENENYLITGKDRSRYVLKLADHDTTPAMIQMENRAVECLIAAGTKLILPRIIPTKEGKIEARLSAGTHTKIRGRLLEFVPGTPWSMAFSLKNQAPPALLGELGKNIALMNQAMAAIPLTRQMRTHHWDLARADQHRHTINRVSDPDRRWILEQVFHHYAAIAIPKFAGLPKALIHGDINDDNIMVENDRIKGILDFGDCLENPVVCDLAIALAYHTLDAEDPLAAAAAVIGGYHAVRPLSLDEILVLYPLMCARLAVSVIISAKRRAVDPNRSSWFVSEERAWEKLARFSTISPAEAARILASHLDLAPYPTKGKSIKSLVQERKRFMGPNLSMAYKSPVKFVQGKAQYLFDHHGRPFLDLYNNVCHVGHCHPLVVKAGQEQMACLNTNTRYLHDGLTDYAKMLCNTLPDELSTCFFLNSGSEANELALRMARTHTNATDLLVVDGAYHGHTNAMIDISPYKFMGKGGKGNPEPWVHVVPVADGFRGNFKGQTPETGRAYGHEVGNIIKKLSAPLAGFITEGLLSCGGQVIPPPAYFKTAFDHVRQAGGVCIVDEVQTGFGRVGEAFWAFELQEVIPDILVLGKPMGNGHPMSAVITTKKIAASFANGMEFFATFGGNPVSCAIGKAVLTVIEQENLQENAEKVGSHMMTGLTALKEKHPMIGDVRGKGLFVGIELVQDPKSLAPATKEAGLLVNRLRQRQILVGTDGPLDNVIKIKPPMVITKEDADMFVRVLDQELATASKRSLPVKKRRKR